eukprot:gene27628-biopygen26382
MNHTFPGSPAAAVVIAIAASEGPNRDTANEGLQTYLYWDAIPTMSSMFKSHPPLTGSTVRDAVALWCSNRLQACELYGPIETWDVSHVTNMAGLFRGLQDFNEDIGAWDVSQVTDMAGLLDGATSFGRRLDRWNIGQVAAPQQAPLCVVLGYFGRLPTDVCREVWQMMWEPLTDGTIRSAAKLWCASPSEASERYGPIEMWDVRQVTNMDRLFESQHAFNGDIRRWDVRNVTSMQGVFLDAKAFNGDIGRWNVSRVTSMKQMFHSAIVFNQPLEAWDVSGVHNMAHMFESAQRFNQPLVAWDVSQ